MPSTMNEFLENALEGTELNEVKPKIENLAKELNTISELLKDASKKIQANDYKKAYKAMDIASYQLDERIDLIKRNI